MIRFLSVFTLVCFILTNVLGGIFANTIPVLFPYVYNNEVITKTDKLSQYAQITESIYKENTPLIVVIHDLHNNSKVQQNIEQIINFISNGSQINKIMIEGAPNKQISTQLFSSVKNKQYINDIVNDLLYNGKISGTESFVIKNNMQNLYGLENWETYSKNIKWNLILKKKYLQETDNIYNSFVKSRTHFPQPKLFSLFSQEINFEKRIINLYEFCKEHNINLSLYPEINKFITITKYKNKKDINKDFNALLNDVKGKVSYQLYMQIATLLKNTNINIKEKLNLVFNIIKNTSPEILLKYEPLLLYFNNIEEQTSVNFYKLIQQAETLENFVLDNFVDYSHKELILVDKFIYFLSEYVNLSLSYDQYIYFEKNKDYLYQISIKYLDIQSIKAINDILKDVDLKNYYSVNEQRNEIFYKNIELFIGTLGEDNKAATDINIIENLNNINSVNIIVVGGFHNELTNILKQKDVSILSIIPRVEETTDLDNKIIRTKNVVYKNALAPPSVLVQADIMTIAFIINKWTQVMTGSGIEFSQQQQAIKQWLFDNDIDIKLEIINGKIYLNSVFIDELLNSQTEQEEIQNIKKKTNNISNILWKCNNLYSNVKVFVLNKIKNIKSFFNTINVFADISSLSSQYISRKLLNERIINNEYQRTLNSLNQKMPDVIVISIDKKEDIDFCEKILADIKNNSNFKNTQIQYVLKDKDGSAAGFIKSIQYLKSAQLNKQFKDLTSVIIDIDTKEKENISRQDLPVKFNGRNITPLELAVLNGIRTCHKFKTGGGIAVIDPRSIYIGNMLPTEDITFISSAVNMEEIQHHRHSLIIKDYPNELEQIYYGFTPDNISDVVERKGIEHKNFYNFDNNKMRQFEIVTGNILISFDEEEKYNEFFNFISEYGNSLMNLSKRINLFQHIFVPFVRLKNKQNVSSYFAKAASSEDREIFIDLADKINNYYQNNNFVQKMKFGVYHQSKSLYSRNYTTQLINKLSSIFKSRQVQPVKSNVKSAIKQKQVKINEKFVEDNALSRAYKMLAQIQDKHLDSSVDYEQVYDTLIEIFRTTSIQKELYISENNNTAKLYRYISDIISNTVAQIDNEKLLNKNRIEQTYLENLKISFLSMQHYTIEYLRLLDYITNLSTLSSYIFPKNSFFEKSKLMPLNRFVFGLAKGIKRTKKNIREQLATVYSSGNFLIDSLYSFPILKDDVESFITSVENPKEKTSVGIQKEWGNRRAIQRFLSLSIAFQSIVTTIIGALNSSSFSIVSIVSATISLASGLGLSVFLHRAGINVGLNNKFYNEKKKEIENELDDSQSVKESMDFFAYDREKIEKIEKFYIKLYKNISNKNKEQVKTTLTLLRQYKENCDLRLINIILKNSKEISLLLNKQPDLQTKLQQFIDYLDKLNIENEPKKYEGIGHGFISDGEIKEKEINGHLQNWFSILKTNTINKQSIDNIIINATEIIRKTNFDTTVLNGKNEDIIISQLQDFISFYDETIKLYSTLKKEEQNKLKPEFEILERTGEYAVQYYKALNYLVSLEILYGYRISEGSKLYFLEQIGIMSIVRNIYGIQTGIFLSKRKFIQSITAVKNIGNELIPGLYDNKTEELVNSFFNEKENPKYFYLGIVESWKSRKMLSRFLPMVIFIEKLTESLIIGTFSFKTLLVSFVTGVGLTVGIHWVSIMMGFFKTLFINKEKISEKPEQSDSVEINRQLLLQKHIDELAKVPYGQMPDLIILVGSGKKYTTKSLNDSVRNIRKFGNLQSVPIEPVITESNGNGNALLDVFSFLQSKQFSRDYPSLSQKNLQDLRIAVININETSSNTINEELDMEILDRKTSPLELALLNAVCMIQKNVKAKGNIVIADPDYMYLGNLVQADNITLISSNVTYDQLKKQNLPLLISDQTNVDQDGSSRLKKLYRNFDYNKISNIAIEYMFNHMYDTENLSLVQMPTYSGLIGINFADDRNFDLLLKFLNIAARYEQTYEGRKFKIDLIQHLLTPLSMLMNKENIFVYLEVLKEPISNLNPQIKNEYDKFFYGLFYELNKEFKSRISDSFINVVSSQNSILTKTGFQNSLFYNSFISLLKTLKNFNAETTINKVKDNIKNIFVSQKQLGLLIVPQLSAFSKHQIFAFDNEISGNIAITSFDQLSDNKQDSGVIINVPVENTTIPAKVFYDVIVDNKGNNHVVVAFMPVLLDSVDMYSSLTEINFMNSILSGDKTKRNELRKQLFMGRAALAFIKELKTNPELNSIYNGSDFIVENIDTSYIVSFDDSGLFSVPELIKDRFFTDDSLQKIKHINIVTVDNDFTNISLDDINNLNLSSLINDYEIFKNGKINLSLLLKLVSSYNYSFADSDFSLFLKNPKLYAQNMLRSVFDTKTTIKDFSNMKTIVGIDINNFSLEQLAYLLNSIKPENMIIKNIFYEGTKLFDISSIDISSEIDRLNNSALQKLKNLLNNNNTLNNNNLFILNNLLQYVKSNEKEYNAFKHFSDTITPEFKKGLENLTARMITNNQNITDENIEKLKSENFDKWNFYYELNEYIQYILYIRYQQIANLLQESGTNLITDTEILQSLSIEIVDLSSIENIDDFLTKLSTNSKLTTLYIDINDITNNPTLLTKFLLLANQLSNVDTFDYVEYGKHFISKYEENILEDTLKQDINIIDISDIDNMNSNNCFSYIYRILSQANIDNTNYDNLFELIAHLYMQYECSNNLNKEKIVLELKGILLAVSELQQIADIPSINHENFDLHTINSILACA